VDLALDHVIVAVPDLDAASEALERRHRLRTVPGGRHLTLGTENVLVPLGGAYLEVITVADPEVAAGNAFGRAVLTGKEAPRFTGWVVRTNQIEDAAATWQTNVAPLSRRTPSGAEVRWRMAGLDDAGDPVRPMVIEWEDQASAPPSMPADHPAGHVSLDRVEIGDPSRLIGIWLPHIDHVALSASNPAGVQRIVLRADDREIRLTPDSFALA
jgi:hypothetical protein